MKQIYTGFILVKKNTGASNIQQVHEIKYINATSYISHTIDYL